MGTQELRRYFRRHNTSGVYTIYLPSGSPLQVYCEQDIDRWGWAVIQRRQDGSVDFYRNWTEYKYGFGDLNGEFWLGLENIYLMTSSGNYSLRMDLTDWDNTTGFAIYDTFSISNESNNYTLHVGGYHGTAGNGLDTKLLIICPQWTSLLDV
ncbi:ficolin-2-like [Pomacea canaliculata]|uniref:ficolin-2-like n=1 Tax=Pomacea canaliculata TaxID=400727 RepID=UPI000D73014B|nr:ficolin-2-like [Pomacea canaliculata]